MIRRPSRCVKRFFSEKTRPRCSSRSNLVKGRPPHSLRTKCPSLQFPGLRRPLDQSLRPVIFAPESSYAYDPVGNLLSTTDRNGRVTIYAFSQTELRKSGPFGAV